MNTNNLPAEHGTNEVLIYIEKGKRTLGPFEITEVIAMRDALVVTGQDLAWTTESQLCLKLDVLLQTMGQSTEESAVTTEIQAKENADSMPNNPPPKITGSPTDIIAHPIDTRKDAENYIALASVVYGIVVLLDLYIGLVSMAVVIAVLTLCLLLLHSRVAAIILLVLSGIEAIASLNGYWVLALISIIQVAITARALEATIKIQNNTFAPSHKQRAAEKTRAPKDQYERNKK